MYNLPLIKVCKYLLVLEDERRVVPSALWHLARQPQHVPVAVHIKVVLVDADLKVSLLHVKNKNNLLYVQNPLN